MLQSPNEAARTAAKSGLRVKITELMPQGKAQFILARPFPMISALITEHGTDTMVKVIFALIKDFCGAFNIGKDGNMNEDQMIDAAAFLLDECGNFRLEDYVMMFTMGKRGDLVKIYNRIDINVIAQMLEEYWTRRNAAGNRAQESKPAELAPPPDAKFVAPEKVFEAIKTVAKEIIQEKQQQDAKGADEAAEDSRRQQSLIRRRAEWEGRIDQLDNTPEP